MTSLSVQSKEWFSASKLAGIQALSETEQADWAKRIGGQIAYNFEDTDTRVMLHDGDLVVDGHLNNGELLIVNGNLTIRGNYHDYQDGIGVLVVLGTMQVENMYSWGAISVEKDLNATGMVLTVYNDFTFEVTGRVNARALVISDKSADYHRGTIDVVLSDSESDDELAWRLIRPEFFTRPDHLEPAEGDDDWFLNFDDGLGSERIADEGEFFRQTLASKDLPKLVRQAMNPATSLGELKALIGTDPLLTQLIAARPNLPEALFPPLQAQSDEVANLWLAMVAPNLMLKGQQGIRLTPELAEKAVENLTTDAALLAQIAADSDPAVRIKLARRDELPTALIVKLASDADEGVRAAILENVLLAFELAPVDIAARMSDAPEVLDQLPNAALDAKQMAALVPKLSPAGLEKLAKRLYSERFEGWRASITSAQREQIAVMILARNAANGSDDPNSHAFLSLSGAEQAKRFNALVQAKQLRPDTVASQTNSLAVMKNIWQLAETLPAVALGAALAENPLLPESIGLEMIGFAAKQPKPDPDSYADSHIDMLENLFGNDDLDRADGSGPLHTDKLVDAGIALALKQGLNPDDTYMQPLLSLSLSSAQITKLDAVFGNNEDWALTKAFARRATRQQMHSGLARWYENADVQAELSELGKLSDERYWEALARAKTPELRQAAARRVELSRPTVQVLFKDENDDVKRYARSNKTLPEADFIAALKLATDDELAQAKPSLKHIDLLLSGPLSRARQAILYSLRAKAQWRLE